MAHTLAMADKRLRSTLKTQNWLFVTGTPRSGTTFVGKVLSAPLGVNYLHEPFNPYCGIPGIDQLYLYMRPDGSTALTYEELIKRVFSLDFTLKTGYFEEDKLWTLLAKSLIGSRSSWLMRFAKMNPFHKTMVIKDPIGCLLTEYLFRNFDVKPIIIIRHPIAVVASAMRLNWEMNLDPVRRQQELVEDYFADEHEFLFAKRMDPVEEAAALWRALNKVLLNQASRHPSWQVIVHETLSQNPVAHFRVLYETFDLPWSSRVEKKVMNLTSQKNPVDVRRHQVHEFRRNSAGLFENSLKMLSREQREKVFEITQDVALQIYARDSFGFDNVH
jgi:hypothetical protein